MATALIEAHGVSTHSRPKAAGAVNQPHDRLRQVSTHSRLKAAGIYSKSDFVIEPVSTHSRLKAAGWHDTNGWFIGAVSTHSRLKAAGGCIYVCGCIAVCFNTQPPEGGWSTNPCSWFTAICFNTQPPEGGWHHIFRAHRFDIEVSTHSRLKAAGSLQSKNIDFIVVSTHSRLKAAGPHFELA